MTVPTYDKFIEPVLRYLATKPEGAAWMTASDRKSLPADNLFIKIVQAGHMTV